MPPTPPRRNPSRSVCRHDTLAALTSQWLRLQGPGKFTVARDYFRTEYLTKILGDPESASVDRRPQDVPGEGRLQGKKELAEGSKRRTVPGPIACLCRFSQRLSGSASEDNQTWRNALAQLLGWRAAVRKTQ